MRRAWRTAALVAVVGLATSACATLGLGGRGGDENTVTLWVRDYQKSIMGTLAAEFNATHETQVEVTLVPATSFVQKLGTAVAAYQGPDIASLDLVFAPYFASQGVLADVTDEVEALPYADDLSPAHVSQVTYEDRIYGVPFTGDVSVMFYNKTLFAEAGLDPEAPPTTWAEVQAAAEAVAGSGEDRSGFVFSGACGGCNIFSLTPLVWASGGDVLNADGTEALLDSEEVGGALGLYRDMYQAGTMPELVRTDNGPNAATAFQSGTVGIRFDGTSFMSTLVSDGAVDFGVAPIPGQDGGSASFAGGDVLSVMTGAANPEGAWEFLEWATDRDAQQVLADNAILPIRMDLLDEIYVPRDPRFQVFADALGVGYTPYSVVENELFNDNNGVWAGLIQDAVFGQGDIADAQRAAQEDAQAILDKATD
ncbi:ABC transporter substrate-binding protein [Cellulomonas triticagri]|uniref:Sugar ABC transporter substrate-binding protein n=1 Tax=Cellulomonas triticagri TaxID=2483352 RepID=A0A3M2JAT8_9CELL|nr:sugar ABC transporter substrate-binding protein [Cellulomonas triticagri]RMI09306.1 sugar ABC transporter substrate-binding protein [Cellulomonas triticagri]